MTATIHEVLGELRATALDERDKGDKFERLIKAYLLNDPEWSARFSDVWRAMMILSSLQVSTNPMSATVSTVVHIRRTNLAAFAMLLSGARTGTRRSRLRAA